MRRLLTLVLLVMCGVNTHAATVTLPNGFVNGHVFMNMPTNQQAPYLMGVADGIIVGAAFGGNEKLGQHMRKCLDVLGGTSRTLLTAVTVFMNTHVDEWASGMHAQLYNILVQNCPLPPNMFK